MKKYLLVGLLCCSGIIVIAQNRLTDTSATCMAYWKKKEKKVYEVKHSKESRYDDAIQNYITYSYEAHLTVKDSTKEGYTIEWANKNYTGTDPNVKYMNQFFKDLKFVYKTDDSGVFLELVNWEEVRDFYINLAALSIPKNDTADAAFEKTKALFQTQEAVQNTLIKDVRLFHTYFGSEYSTRKQVTQTTLPNAFGGEPIPALQTLQVTRLHNGGPTYTLRATQEIDRVNGAPFVKELMQLYGVPVGETDKELEEMFNNFSMKDETEMDLQVKSGWPATLQFKRSAKVMTASQSETYRFTSKPDAEAVHMRMDK